MQPKADSKFLFDLQNKLQEELKSEHKALSKLYLILATGSLTLFVSQAKNLPKSEFLIYIYAFLLTSIFLGFIVQFLHLNYTRNMVKKVSKVNKDLESAPANHQEIYQHFRKTFSSRCYIFWIERCFWAQTLFFGSGFLLISVLLIRKTYQ